MLTCLVKSRNGQSTIRLDKCGTCMILGDSDGGVMHGESNRLQEMICSEVADRSSMG